METIGSILLGARKRTGATALLFTGRARRGGECVRRGGGVHFRPSLLLLRRLRNALALSCADVLDRGAEVRKFWVAIGSGIER